MESGLLAGVNMVLSRHSLTHMFKDYKLLCDWLAVFSWAERWANGRAGYKSRSLDPKKRQLVILAKEASWMSKLIQFTATP
ncbi:hypothetical protein Pmani_008464 [Petrolisthes manimaculis]|uniref:Uncharacterized protein n=1 Tax=Petrolisthes manimaculis TaxID=1843537 RepID=A0AAE1Q8V5_9EUCA|nr:hypothetical protein Pmani_008464 [Petrolisthes manimaculis]